jgi:aromatic ring-opening dioxygenase catalytic subunit (LigB family)
MSPAALTKPLPVYFIGHAGVGLLFNETQNNHTVQQNLRDIGEEIRAIRPRPKAIITLSGHFEAGEIHGPGVIEGSMHRRNLNIESSS